MQRGYLILSLGALLGVAVAAFLARGMRQQNDEHCQPAEKIQPRVSRSLGRGRWKWSSLLGHSNPFNAALRVFRRLDNPGILELAGWFYSEPVPRKATDEYRRMP